VPVKLSFILEACLEIILLDLLGQKDSSPNKIENIRLLLKLLRLCWGTRVSSKPQKQIDSKKINNEEIMPTEKELSSLSTRLLEIVKQAR
jgi:hypothetical protein